MQSQNNVDATVGTPFDIRFYNNVTTGSSAHVYFDSDMLNLVSRASRLSGIATGAGTTGAGETNVYTFKPQREGISEIFVATGRGWGKKPRKVTVYNVFASAGESSDGSETSESFESSERSGDTETEEDSGSESDGSEDEFSIRRAW